MQPEASGIARINLVLEPSEVEYLDAVAAEKCELLTSSPQTHLPGVAVPVMAALRPNDPVFKACALMTVDEFCVLQLAVLGPAPVPGLCTLVGNPKPTPTPTPNPSPSGCAWPGSSAKSLHNWWIAASPIFPHAADSLTPTDIAPPPPIPLQSFHGQAAQNPVLAKEPMCVPVEAVGATTACQDQDSQEGDLCSIGDERVTFEGVCGQDGSGSDMLVRACMRMGWVGGGRGVGGCECDGFTIFGCFRSRV
jgi:hypothetical protein